MIGERYRSTGITIDRQPRDTRWSVSLQFFDASFPKHDTTEGVLRVRYLETDLTRAVDVLRAAAERLGIDFGRADAMRPTVYVKGDGEDETGEGDRPDGRRLRRIANEQARRLDWEPVYSDR